MTNSLLALIIVQVTTNFQPISVTRHLPERADGAGDIYEEIVTIVTNKTANFAYTNSLGQVNQHGVLLESIQCTNYLTRFRTNPLPRVTYSIVKPAPEMTGAQTTAPSLPPIP